MTFTPRVPQQSTTVDYADTRCFTELKLVTPPTPTNVPKSGHVVSASVVDSSGSELFEVGSHITNSNGDADVWVITGDSNGATYSDHNLRAFGPAGQNETKTTDAWYISDLSSGFTIGSPTHSCYSLLLSTSMVPTWIVPTWLLGLMLTQVLACQQTVRHLWRTIYEFDGTPMTLI